MQVRVAAIAPCSRPRPCPAARARPPCRRCTLPAARGAGARPPPRRAAGPRRWGRAPAACARRSTPRRSGSPGFPPPRRPAGWGACRSTRSRPAPAGPRRFLILGQRGACGLHGREGGLAGGGAGAVGLLPRGPVALGLRCGSSSRGRSLALELPGSGGLAHLLGEAGLALLQGAAGGGRGGHGLVGLALDG